ncbi:MAG: ImmA/IrrE family metallo-endopeptidase [Candidatus Eisenbacteria bacterium]|nr:ImmA/IrrE family metallo-endopeptidase [Candidatus Eisenbacteria bacterium]
MTRVEVRPEMLRWGRERAGFNLHDLGRRFPKLESWERGDGRPTLKQLERYAKSTFTPIGYFFLPEPPVEQVPLPDFRAPRKVRLGRPSPNLLDTVYLCRQRQDWYRQYAKTEGERPRAFVGSAQLSNTAEEIAGRMRQALGFDLEARRDCPTWTEALRKFIDQTDSIGVLVMVSGIVLNNTRRRLDPDEFRGFALADEWAPLVFVNGADTRAAQMFTLAHELAHLWLGQSALSDIDPAVPPQHEVERWCNRVAAELLVPVRALRGEYRLGAELGGEAQRLARHFKVSTLVILRRIYDAEEVSKEEFEEAYSREKERLHAHAAGGGGDFYLTLAARVGKRFARAMMVSTLEGRSSFTEAFRLLGLRKMATFHDLGLSLGMRT